MGFGSRSPAIELAFRIFLSIPLAIDAITVVLITLKKSPRRSLRDAERHSMPVQDIQRRKASIAAMER